MPYKSRAQQRLFHHLVSQGKLAPEVVEEYDAASKGKKIPQFVKRKAFGGQVEAKAGVHCPACDYPLDAAPVAMDAGEGCPRCGYGDAKEVPHKAMGGEIQDVTAYRARGGEQLRSDQKYRKEYFDSFEKQRMEAAAIEARYQALRDELATKYPAKKDKTPVPVYNKRGERTEQSVRADQNPMRFNPSRNERKFLEAQESPLWSLRKDLATRGSRSGEPSDYSVGYITDGDYEGQMYAHGGEICEHCGSDMKADLKELYPSKKRRLDDGKIRPFGQMFAQALKRGR